MKKRVAEFRRVVTFTAYTPVTRYTRGQTENLERALIEKSRRKSMAAFVAEGGLS